MPSSPAVATSASARQPAVRNTETVFPSSFATLGTSNSVDTTGEGPPASIQQFANLVPGQYIGGGLPVQRLFGRMGGLVHYVPIGMVDDIDWTPPRITRTAATAGNGAATFEVDAIDAQSGVERVVVLYKSAAGATNDDADTWTSIDLTRSDTTWTGSGSYAASVTPPLEYMVQTVNGDGVVGVATSKGEMFRTTTSDTPPTPPTPPTPSTPPTPPMSPTPDDPGPPGTDPGSPDDPNDVAAAGAVFVAIEPTRIADTRVTAPQSAGTTVELQVTGRNGVPTGSDGTICVYTSATTDILIDITGAFTPDSGLTTLDTRTSRTVRSDRMHERAPGSR